MLYLYLVNPRGSEPGPDRLQIDIVTTMAEDISILLQKYNDLDLKAVLDYQRFNEYAIVHHSSSIEGSTLTESETRLLLEENITPKGKPLTHTLMVKDHFEALHYVLDAVRTQTAVNNPFIQDINAHVMKHTGSFYRTPLGDVDATKGEFRKGNVSAGTTYFPNYDKVEKLTTALSKNLTENLPLMQTKEDQLKLSFSAHFDLVSIHPFYDGNGRTSRLLMNFVQEYYQLPLAIVFKEDKADYYTALQDTRKHKDVQIFFDFMFAQYRKHLEQEIRSYNDALRPTDPPPTRRTGYHFSIFF